MNTLRTCGTLAALAVAGAVLAQEPGEPRPESTTPREGAAERPQPGETWTPESADRGAEDRRPKPHPAEETSERSPTDQAPARELEPATSPAEGTAADPTPPGRTPQQTAERTQETGELVGTQVVNTEDSHLGAVVDVVFDAKGQPSHLVVASGGEMAAVPYAAAGSKMKGHKIVMDEQEFEEAPKVRQGEWRSQSETWKGESDQYWQRSPGNRDR